MIVFKQNKCVFMSISTRLYLNKENLKPQELYKNKKFKETDKLTESTERVALKTIHTTLSQPKKRERVEKESILPKRKEKHTPSRSTRSKDSSKKIKGAAPEKIKKRISVSLAPKIRYSQLFVSPETTCGKKIDALVEEILNYGWDDTKAPLKLVEMGDKLPTSLDNRRLVALQQIA